MKLASKNFCLAVASAALVLTGCSKKPMRPTPTDTAPLGMRPGGPDVNQPPGNASFGLEAPGLVDRGNQNLNGENREALQAQTVYFDYDQSAIKPAERAKLKIAKEYLDKNPTHRL